MNRSKLRGSTIGGGGWAGVGALAAPSALVVAASASFAFKLVARLLPVGGVAIATAAAAAALGGMGMSWTRGTSGMASLRTNFFRFFAYSCEQKPTGTKKERGEQARRDVSVHPFLLHRLVCDLVEFRLLLDELGHLGEPRLGVLALLGDRTRRIPEVRPEVTRARLEGGERSRMGQEGGGGRRRQGSRGGGRHAADGGAGAEWSWRLQQRRTALGTTATRARRSRYTRRACAGRTRSRLAGGGGKDDVGFSYRSSSGLRWPDAGRTTRRRGRTKPNRRRR